MAVQIVGADLAGAGGHDLSSLAAVPDVRRRPVALLVTLDAPDLLAGFFIQGDEERSIVVVIHDVDATLMQHGRGGRAPAVAHVEWAITLRPYGLAVHVEAEQAEVAEVGVDAFAVGHRGLGRGAVLEEAGDLGRAAMALAVPQNCAGLEGEAVDPP